MSYFILKDDAVEVLHSICQQIWKTQQWPQKWKGQFSFWSERKAMPVKVVQSCPTLCNRIDYTVHGILWARILEWVTFPFSGGSFQVNPGLLHCRRILYQLSHKGSPRILEGVAYPFSADLPDPGIEPGSHALQPDSLPTEL